MRNSPVSAAGTAASSPTTGSAVISADGRYRYRLTRTWGPGPTAVFLMLNPSTADATRNDPTIRRCTAYARSWDCGSLTAVNLYAFRATKPADLWHADDPVGRDNDQFLTQAAATAHDSGGPLVAAWGTRARPERVAEILALPGMDQLHALALTHSGQPRHPLYLPNRLLPQPWPPPNPTEHHQPL